MDTNCFLFFLSKILQKIMDKNMQIFFVFLLEKECCKGIYQGLFFCAITIIVCGFSFFGKIEPIL